MNLDKRVIGVAGVLLVAGALNFFEVIPEGNRDALFWIGPLAGLYLLLVSLTGKRPEKFVTEEPSPVTTIPKEAPVKIPDATSGRAQVAIFLGRMQSKGRLVDFLMEDISNLPDERVGAVARMVHRGCSGVLKDAFAPEPIQPGNEGSRISLPEDFSRKAFRLSGNTGMAGKGEGVLRHHGWQSTKVNLPQPMDGEEETGESVILCPAEVEFEQ